MNNVKTGNSLGPLQDAGGFVLKLVQQRFV